MSMIRKLVQTQVTEIGDDEVEVVMSTGAIARDGHILVPGGADLAQYRANPVVLWQHDPGQPVGTAEGVRVDGDKIVARIRFAPLGVSEVADRTRGLVKSGVIGAVSVGFDPTEGEPLDPARPRGGQRFTGWELLECSFVSVPADTGAVVTARAHATATADEEAAIIPIGYAENVEALERAAPASVVQPQLRAGKMLSGTNRDRLEAIHGSIDDARSELREFINDTDITEIQTSDGTDEADGATNGRGLSVDYRRRQVAMLELAATH